MTQASTWANLAAPVHEWVELRDLLRRDRGRASFSKDGLPYPSDSKGWLREHLRRYTENPLLTTLAPVVMKHRFIGGRVHIDDFGVVRCLNCDGVLAIFSSVTTPSPGNVARCSKDRP